MLDAVLDPQGRLVVVGGLTSAEGVSRNGIARYLPDGTLDTTFTTTGSGFDGAVSSVAVDSTGRVLVGGNFTHYDGVPAPRIARLTPTGALDTTFTTGSGFDGSAFYPAIDSTGRIVVAGDFTTYGGAPARQVARLSSTGALDTTFTTGSGVDDDIYDLAIDSTDEVLVGGRFTTYDGVPTPHLARLTTTGALDTTLRTGTGPDAGVNVVVSGTDGDVYVLGDFTTYDGATANRVLRLAAAPESLTYDPNGGTGTVPATQTARTGGTVTVADGTGLTRAGYRFSGWNTAADGSGTARAAGATTTLTASVTLYAQWAAVPTTDPVPGAGAASITLVGGAGSVAARAPFTVAATGLEPGSTYTVTLHSTPVVLLTGSAPADGTVQVSATLPAHVPAGAHRLVLEATAADGTPLLVETAFTVDADGRITTGALAATGDDTALPLTALGTVLLLAGTGAVLVGRRRQH
ncbi:InlB B-repeat-containing protein [Klenkia taihuensis]|uniref:InlB B-repeat-containing protein n=1 Tax=Klenkia taihuensis TaxID=1225127 RepID=UPI000AD34A97|nr:InlB B-repeat-containing protein [Klenkia taihuensis]GHE12113.1 hypothetical protein GCM10011381_28550 [Klenkia taihuensis]